GAVEYTDDWRTFCECFLDENDEHFTTNPFVLGIQGTWRPVSSYVHLSGRTQAYENKNSNIRQDGMFTTYTPFYKLNAGSWEIDRQNWTYTSSVTEFSPFGQALETIDALDRYSSSLFGYNQTLPMAVAANTRYRQLGFDGFEDYDYDNCSDNHFRIGENAVIDNTESHTGRNSIIVSAGDPVVFSNVFQEDCDDPCDWLVSIQLKGGTKADPVGSAIVSTSSATPITFTYQIVGGNPIVGLSVDGDQLLIGGLLPTDPGTVVIVTMTDENGCVQIVEI
ncbi:MAG: hypothetical protein ACI837_001131, partial [Crocinitomicaceae bacterium]